MKTAFRQNLEVVHVIRVVSAHHLLRGRTNVFWKSSLYKEKQSDLRRVISQVPSSTATMDASIRIKAYRFVAYSAVTFSVVSVLSVCITLPMVYSFINQVRLQMHNDIQHCKVGGAFTWWVMTLPVQVYAISWDDFIKGTIF